MKTKTKDIWEFLELPARNAEEVKALFEWSLNCQQDKPNVWTLFLHTIGYAQERWGDNQTLNMAELALGYVEQDYLADALKEYSGAPRDVEDWLDELHTKEG